MWQFLGYFLARRSLNWMRCSNCSA